jgi:hypothetical protein
MASSIHGDFKIPFMIERRRLLESVIHRNFTNRHDAKSNTFPSRCDNEQTYLPSPERCHLALVTKACLGSMFGKTYFRMQRSDHQLRDGCTDSTPLLAGD